MTTPRDPDRLLSAYLADGIDVLPDRVVDAVLDEAHRTRQRAVLGPRRTPVMNSTFKVILAAAAVVVVAVVGVGISLLPRSNPSVGSGPSAPPSRTPGSSPAASSSPALAPISLTGQIAIVRSVEGNIDIYMMDLDRTGVARLTADPADDVQPAWSPDGRTLFFARRPAQGGEESDIYALDIESGNEVRLTDDPGVEQQPLVSPDGTQVAFETWPSSAGWYVMDPDGSNRRQVFALPDDTYVGIGWNADGTALYLIRSGVEILRVDVATGDVAPAVAGGNEEISLSPDGTTFAFQSDGLSPGGIFLMDADGSNVRHLTGSWSQGGPISWSPDGQYLVFTLSDGWLYLVGADGRGLTRWTDSDNGFAWRPTP